MKVMINPKYEYLREYVKHVPEEFESKGREIHSGRNLIKVFSVNGLDINVKRYAIPPFVNRVAYSLFRPSKGKRAFVYPEILHQKGFDTPCPIAYIEEKKLGLIGHSYFISIQSVYQHNFCEFGNADVKDCEDVITAFAKYTARLHESGVLHLDYSPGNILFDKVDDEYRFSLVDINRMHFGEIDIERGCANFARLWGQTAFFVLLAKEYARSRKADEDECVRWVLHYRKKFWMRYRNRHKVWFQLDI